MPRVTTQVAEYGMDACRRGASRRYFEYMMDDGPILGQWYTALGNWWEASVRTEIASQLALMPDLELTDDQIDRLTWGVAVELDYRWNISPKREIPPGYEPTVFKD